MNPQIHSESFRDLAPRVERRAVIDVGSNSVKLLVADVGWTLKPVLKLRLRTGLGQGAFRTRCLQPEAIARTVDAVQTFAAEAVGLGCASIQVLATSAAREATNGNELAQAVQKATGLRVEIISGEQEADYVFEGVTSDPLIGAQAVLILKVGGGSTEWVVGESGSIHFRKSTRIGTVRLLEFDPQGDPPGYAALARLRATVREFVQAEVSPSLEPVLRSFCGRTVRLVGLGGSLEALARLADGRPDSGQRSTLWQEQLVKQVELVWGLTVQERRQLNGLDAERAEVILPGGVLCEAALNQFGFDEVLISGRGLREGALLAGAARLNRRLRLRLGEPGLKLGSEAWGMGTQLAAEAGLLKSASPPPQPS